MSDLKTRKHSGSVSDYLESIEDEQQRRDSRELVKLMQSVTGSKPSMWGTAILGFGSYRYRYANGREGDWFLCGFSPRKQALSIYIMAGFKRYPELMGKLGKFKTGKSCLYVKKLDDIDRAVLKELVEESVAYLRATH